MNRRSFSQFSLLTSIAAIWPTTQIFKPKPSKKIENIFIHHVFFWLKNPESLEDLQKLVDGLEKLRSVNSLASYHIGIPASTSRDVIDGSYNISWFTTFQTKEDQDAYQIDPLHLEFVATCNTVWSKVVVYDSIDVDPK